MRKSARRAYTPDEIKLWEYAFRVARHAVREHVRSAGVVTRGSSVDRLGEGFAQAISRAKQVAEKAMRTTGRMEDES